MNVLAVDGKPVPDGANVRLDKDMARIETTRDNGESAFPVAPQSGSPDGCLTSGSDGMTLRDYFAAHAIDAAAKILDADWATSLHDMTRRAYRIADRMLEARDWEAKK
jgi:hypothetical protein